MSENHGPLDDLDPIQAALKRAVSRRTLIRRAAIGGAALSTAPLLAACDIGDDDEDGEAADTDRDLGERKPVEPDVLLRHPRRVGERLLGDLPERHPRRRSEVRRQGHGPAARAVRGRGYVDLLNQAIVAEPDGIFCSILDQNAVDQPLRQAIESGIPVIAVNVPDTRS